MLWRQSSLGVRRDRTGVNLCPAFELIDFRLSGSERQHNGVIPTHASNFVAINIQFLNADNSALLASIAPDVFDHHIIPEYLRLFLEDPRHLMAVATEKQTVVGMASAVEYFHPDKPPQLWINEVGVASTHRRKGIGRMLVEAILEIADQRNCVYAWLGTDVNNVAGRACFASVPDGEKPQSFILYEWDLQK